jgi:orotate phosphoribosyltransferase
MKVTDEQYKVLAKWVHAYIDKYCILRGVDLPAKVGSTRYSWMFYLRRGLFNSQFNFNIGQMFYYYLERLDPEFNFQITGLETASAPMLTAIPMVAQLMGSDLNAFIVRKERKKYGLENIVEGLPNDKPAIMFDDLCNSSVSLAECLQKLIEEGITVANVAFTIVNKSNEGVHTEQRLKSDMYLPPEIQVISLFTLDDFNLNNPSH